MQSSVLEKENEIVVAEIQVIDATIPIHVARQIADLLTKRLTELQSKPVADIWADYGLDSHV